MAARIVEGLFTGTKRWALEAALVKGGHDWTKRGPRDPMSGAELVARILCWLDSLNDPFGRIYRGHHACQDDCQLSAKIEAVSGWYGRPGALVEALLSCHFLDRNRYGFKWHDYEKLNRLTIYDRIKKRKKRGDGKGDRRRDQRGDQRGDKSGDKRGASESGDSSEGIPSGAGAPATRSGSLRAAPGEQSEPLVHDRSHIRRRVSS